MSLPQRSGQHKKNSLTLEWRKGRYFTSGQMDNSSFIQGKGIIKTGKLEFEHVYFVKDLKYNLFSVSQIHDNKNSVLFTDSECIVLGRDFKLLDDANILLRTPRQHNMYFIDLNNIIPHRDLTCLVAKASADECILWHRRSTSFGRWLDLTYVENEEALIHYMLQKQKVYDIDHYDLSLIYNVNGYTLHFGRREFCLNTGFKFGMLSFHLLSVIEDEERFTNLSDEDSIRVYLLLYLEVIFMGHALGSAVDDVITRKTKGTNLKHKVNTVGQKYKVESVGKQCDLGDKCQDLKSWEEEQNRPSKCVDKIYCNYYLKKFPITSGWRHCKFPWCNDVVMGRLFWDSLIGFDNNRLGWLRDKHIGFWVQYMWHFKQSSQDWSMVSCCFLTLLLQESMPLFYATDEIYSLAWMDVEQETGVFASKGIDPTDCNKRLHCHKFLSLKWNLQIL
nr:phospholipase-like, aminotransferase-like mobile domain protein [Tanacetum cinerariifolium]